MAMLDRLVRGAVLAHADAVVGQHPNHAQVRKGREADRRAHVVGKDQEGRAEGDDAAVQAMPLRMAPMPCSRTPK